MRATTLTIVAGIADAVGYITMGGVFAANMTGNTVLAGIAAAERNHTDAGTISRRCSPSSSAPCWRACCCGCGTSPTPAWRRGRIAGRVGFLP